MRYCYADKRLEFTSKLAPRELQSEKVFKSQNSSDINLHAWYELSSTVTQTSWVFGHWAALMGNCSVPNIYALDTGCVWGNHLTILRWHDKKVFIEPAHVLSD